MLFQGVCKIYEEHLKRNNPNIPSITYDISQLFSFVDEVGSFLIALIMKGLKDPYQSLRTSCSEEEYIFLKNHLYQPENH